MRAHFDRGAPGCGWDQTRLHLCTLETWRLKSSAGRNTAVITLLTLPYSDLMLPPPHLPRPQFPLFLFPPSLLSVTDGLPGV